MRHLKHKKHFNMTGTHRKAMFRNMVTSLFTYERITTTLPKAKELRRIAEKIITLGKKGDLGSRRKALAYVRTKDATTKVFDSFAERYKERSGGYTRIFKLGPRAGDNAPMAMIELVDRDVSAMPKKRVKRVPVTEEA